MRCESGSRSLLLAGFLAAALAAAAAPSPAQTGAIGLHDPAIARHGDSYYIFHTGNGIPIKRSRDLVTWEAAGRVFESMPAWVAAAVPAARNSIWAPDISFFNGKYHLYYSVSSFGSQRSAIGLATNTTLDPASPDYRWVDQGMVIRSVPGVSTHNAIDPNLVLDARGEPWMNWGSFWGGIKMRKIDRRTGLLSARDTTLYSLAARRGVDATTGPDEDQSIEGSYIIRRGDFYYLFVSFDMCCRGARSTYNVRVGRSERVTGPYVDERGEVMTRGGGDVVLGTVGRVRGPGHNSILVDGDRHFLVHHYYDAEESGRSKLQIRPITWTANGWPVAGEPLTGQVSTADPPPRGPAAPDPERVHDPAIIRQGDTYYVFSTGGGIPIRRSTDLVRWEPAGTVFDSLPPWASQEVPGVRDIWAPDVSYFNGCYHLYYSLSTFGRNRSAIGLATNRTLDPASPDYRWEDQGKVVESFQDVSTHNAIDPNIVLDERRQPWLSWGSFWGGVKMRRIDPTTGLASREDTTTYSLAARTAIDAAIGPNRPRSVEAPFIIRRGEHYYLFLSFDRCCAGVNSTYNIRVGRSESVTGP